MADLKEWVRKYLLFIIPNTLQRCRGTDKEEDAVLDKLLLLRRLEALLRMNKSVFHNHRQSLLQSSFFYDL